ncbi:MAG TPA: hypothetical protein VL463_20700 [Kofleriaceae bacterium]|jgi:tetratricopeptide (TPR) repeat protein|nr:hypothetical protein [Kofleriaceae bacterium]
MKVALAIVALTATAVRAQPPSDPRAEAQAHAASAKVHFDKGEYAEAAADYKEAYRLLPSVGLLYNLGQAYRLAGDCEHASQAYREYLHLAPDSPYRATVEQNLAAANACKPAEPAPQPEPQPPPPPPSVEVKPPAPAITAVAPPPVEDHSGMRIAGLSVGGAGIVFVAAGAYFALDASHAQRDVAAFYEKGGSWDDIAATDERGRRSRTLSIVGFGVGAAAIAAGVTMYFMSEERPVAIVPTSGGGQVVMSWHF